MKLPFVAKSFVYIALMSAFINPRLGRAEWMDADEWLSAQKHNIEQDDYASIYAIEAIKGQLKKTRSSCFLSCFKAAPQVSSTLLETFKDAYSTLEKSHGAPDLALLIYFADQYSYKIQNGKSGPASYNIRTADPTKYREVFFEPTENKGLFLNFGLLSQGSYKDVYEVYQFHPWRSMVKIQPRIVTDKPKNDAELANYRKVSKSKFEKELRIIQWIKTLSPEDQKVFPETEFIIPEKGIYQKRYRSNLLARIMSRKLETTYSEKVTILKQIARAVQILHHQHFIHGDLKPHNILGEGTQFVVSDFGSLVEIKNYKKRKISHHPIQGTRLWQAPEADQPWNPDSIAQELEKLKKTDVFSLGLITHFVHHKDNLWMSKCVKADSSVTSEFEKCFSNQIAEFINQSNLDALDHLSLDAVQLDPNKRPDIDEFLKALAKIETGSKKLSVALEPHSYLEPIENR